MGTCESQRRLGHHSVRRTTIATDSSDLFTLAAFGIETTSRAGEPPAPGERVGDAEVMLAAAEGSDAFGA
jgi:hypothetical protein